MNNVFTQILEDAQALRRARQGERKQAEQSFNALPHHTKREILRQKVREVAAEAFGKELPKPRVYRSPFAKPTK